MGANYTHYRPRWEHNMGSGSLPYAACSPEEKISRDKEAYVRDEITIGEFEQRVGDALRSRDRSREAICIAIPKENPVASWSDHLMSIPTQVMGYHEIWLTPNELRRMAELKLAGGQL